MVRVQQQWLSFIRTWCMHVSGSNMAFIAVLTVTMRTLLQRSRKSRDPCRTSSAWQAPSLHPQLRFRDTFRTRKYPQTGLECSSGISHANLQLTPLRNSFGWYPIGNFSHIGFGLKELKQNHQQRMYTNEIASIFQIHLQHESERWHGIGVLARTADNPESRKGCLLLHFRS